MSPLAWVLVVAGGWLLLAAVVGLVVGRVIRNRDRKPPHVEPERRPRRGGPQQWPPS